MRIVIVSDTHCHEPDLPEGDILIHAGDLSNRGFRSEIFKQFCWLEKQMVKYRNTIIIPGNHDFYFEDRLEEAREDCKVLGINLLINEEITIDGLKFYGSPMVPEYHNWAFNVPKKKIGSYWKLIPEDVDVLITHGPPYEILDREGGENLGCRSLAHRVQCLEKLKLHVFGHIHGGFGQLSRYGKCFINAAYKSNWGTFTHDV